MDTGFQDKHPHDHTEQQDGGHTVNAAQVQPEHGQQRCQRHQQVVDLQFGCVEQCDDQDGPEVIENGECQQEHLERHGRAGPHKSKDAEGKGDVGGRWDRPTADRCGISPVECHIEESRDRHAANSGRARQNHVAGVLELTFQEFALQFQTDEEEEDRHEPVIDPKDQRLLQAGVINGYGKITAKDTIVDRLQGRVGNDHGGQR